ncbi:MAG TPA: arylsulfatase [Thermoanaerobaculia bacterium]|nr:arylsulfatase [Thermoanaerobaculia bacterium]
MNLRRMTTALGLALGLLVAASPAAAQGAKAAPKADARKPNIVVIWGDDIGQSDVSAYSMGLMGFHTPNIDRVAKEGMLFTDFYAEQSCTAGRSSFITGQVGLRTGNTKVGMPGAAQGLQARDVTIAQLLKGQGYATGQFGKNHLGDRNEYLPTVHGFDEFYGNLYHLNAEEEPELPDYPKDPAFRAKFGPRGVMDCKASDKDDATVDPRFGKVGKQVCKDTGPLTKKRMETIDDDIAARAVDFIQRMNKAGKPVFVWVNFTHMHLRTHTKPESLGQASRAQFGRAQSPYHDTMIDHDGNVGTVLKALDDLGMAENSIVMYSTDNGPHMNSWPDGGMTPFRNEKNSNWEGAYRVPAMVRWPGHIKPGTISNEIVSHLDWLPTFLAAAGVPDVKEQLLKGMDVGGTTYKVHLDGYNMLPYFTGQVAQSPREEFLYFNDDSNLVALRHNNMKYVFAEQRAPGTMRIWSEPFVTLRVPKIFNLRMDPYERADITSNTYYDWTLNEVFALVPAQAVVGKFLESFKEFPPSQRAGSFSVEQVLESMREGAETSK